MQAKPMIRQTKPIILLLALVGLAASYRISTGSRSIIPFNFQTPEEKG